MFLACLQIGTVWVNDPPFLLCNKNLNSVGKLPCYSHTIATVDINDKVSRLLNVSLVLDIPVRACSRTWSYYIQL